MLNLFEQRAAANRNNSLPRIIAGPRRFWLARLLVNGIGQAGAAFLIAWLTRQTLAAGRSGSLTLEAFPYEILAGLALIGLLILGLRVLEQVDAERLGQDYVMKVRLALYQRMAAVPQRLAGGLAMPAYRSQNVVTLPPRRGVILSRRLRHNPAQAYFLYVPKLWWASATSNAIPGYAPANASIANRARRGSNAASAGLTPCATPP